MKAGDFFYSKAGVVHAIGPGLTLIEVQQNVDLTYRLYDYGSDRELHLDAGVAASEPEPFVPLPAPPQDGSGPAILAEGPKFVIERLGGGVRAVDAGDMAWLVPVTGAGEVDGVAWRAGECLTLEGWSVIEAEDGSDVLLAYPGDKRR